MIQAAHEEGVDGIDPQITDEHLAGRAAKDFEAFAELYRRHLCSVFRYFRVQVRDTATAEDLTAQVFFKALARAHTFRNQGPYTAWLFTIASNLLASWRSRSGRVIAVDAVPEEPDPGVTPSAAVVRQEDGVAVRQAVAALTPMQREIVTLRYLNDLSIGEVARVTRKSEGSIRILLHRARNQLRRRLEGHVTT